LGYTTLGVSLLVPTHHMEGFGPISIRDSVHSWPFGIISKFV
jgi:hypothetical protein